MRFSKWFLLTLMSFLCGLVASSKRFDYTGYKIYEAIPQNEVQLQFLANISLSNENDFLNFVNIPKESLHVVVPPNEQAAFEKVLAKESINIKVVNDDLPKTIRSEQRPIPRTYLTTIDFSRYYRHFEINHYLDNLAQQYSNRALVQTIGRSYEGRPIKAITITNGVPGNKKVILIDAGIHARERIAPASALYIIYKLVEDFKNSQDLLEAYNWIIIPSVNPDGYEYTFTHDRLWRKTRKPNLNCPQGAVGNLSRVGQGQVFDICSGKFVQVDVSKFAASERPRVICGFGTDGNRNYDSHWAEIGTSNNSCHNQYYGTHAFSEVETQAVRDAMQKVAGAAKMYLSLHSKGSLILYPWGYTRALPKNLKDIEKVAYAGVKAIKRKSGRQYRVGSVSNIMYPAAGGSVDYALEKVGIPISMCMELPFGGSDLVGGYDPSISEMRDIVKETWAGIRAMARKVQQIFK